MDNLKDVAAERGYLAALFRHGSELYLDTADMVGTGTITDPANQLVYACLQEACRERPPGPLDVPSVLSAAASLGLSNHLETGDAARHLQAVVRTQIDEAAGRRLAGRLRRLEVGRLLDAQLDVARGNLSQLKGDEPVDRILAAAEAPIFDLTSLLNSSGGEGTVLLGEHAEEYYRHLMDHPVEQLGVATGFPMYDRAIGGGLRPNSLNVFGARAKAGKSYIVDRFCLNIARSGVPVLNLDTEMSRDEHLVRLGAMVTGLPVWDIERGRVGTVAQRREAMVVAGRELNGLPLYSRSISAEPLEETLAHMRRWVVRRVGLAEDGKAKPCVIFYDYLKLMAAEHLTSSGMSEYQAMGFVATSLKNFAARYGVALVAMVQLNRDGIDREDVTALSQSDRISWFCTSLFYYKQKSEAELLEDGPEWSHKLVYVLSRHGEGLPPGDYINVRARYGTGELSEGPTKSALVQLERGGLGG